VFDAAGLADSHVHWIIENWGSQPEATGDPCEGARSPTEHSHFFTESGQFGSRDEHGQQVDDGTYEAVDADTLAFPGAGFGYDRDIIVDYEITGDVVTFDVVLPEQCEDTCKEAYAWALSAFASGPWNREEAST